MKVNVEDISSTEKKLEVTIPVEDIIERREDMFDQVKGTANIKGFRPGKAPRHLVESMYGESINEEIVSKIVSETFESAVAEASVTPISRPDINPGKVSTKEDFKYEATFEVIPEFEISEYEGLELEKVVYTIEQKQIDETLDRLKEDNAKSEPIKRKRKARKGDYVFVDYKGTLENGETIDDLNRENVRFILGEDQLIPEFEENILGKKPEEEATFHITYPEDFGVKEAAGQTVEFVLKINEIHDKVLPEIDDEFAKELGLEGVDDLKTKIEEDLVNQYENMTNTKLREQILEILVKNNDFDVPNSLVQNEQHRLKQEFATSFQRQGLELPEIGKEAEEKFTEKATESVKGSILLNKISSLQNIEPTAEEVDHRIKHISESYQVPFETVKESYEKNNMIESIESAITEKKVLDFIIEKAKITEVEPEPEVVDNENNN